MSDNTAIEWTDTTWNPLLGCTRVSAGCDSCYAINTATIRASNPHPKVAAAFAGLTERRDGRLDWTSRVNLLPDRLAQPLTWRKPRRVFVNSQADLFHDAVPLSFIERVFAVMLAAEHHTFQMLTKRHARMASILRRGTFEDTVFEIAVRDYGLDPARDQRRWWPLPNVWLGVSVENQQWADIRVPALLDTPAAVRWLSCEPLLGPVNLDRWLGEEVASQAVASAAVAHGVQSREYEYRLGRYFDDRARPHLSWIVAGGESGRGARPMHPDWVRSLRDQCVTAAVPFFYKQAGVWAVVDDSGPDGWRARRETDWYVRHDGRAWPLAEPHGSEDGTEVLVRRVSKKDAGRELDGRTWDEYPRAVEAVA